MNTTPSFSYKNTKRGIIATILSVCLLLCLFVVFGVNLNKPTYDDSMNSTAYPATLTAIAAGCGDIYQIPPVPGNFGMIPEEFWQKNPTVDKNTDSDFVPTPQYITVPIFGYMADTGLNVEQVKFYTMEELQDNPISRHTILRTMYDDNITVVWYTKDLPPADIDWLETYANTEKRGQILVLPWETQDKPMIQGREIAYASWGMSQSCKLFDEIVLEEFIEFEEEHRVERPNNIPVIEVGENGVLPPIKFNIETENN